MQQTLALSDLRGHADEVTSPAGLNDGDLIVFVSRNASYPPAQQLPIHRVEGAGCRQLSDSRETTIDFQVFHVWKLR